MQNTGDPFIKRKKQAQPSGKGREGKARQNRPNMENKPAADQKNNQKTK